MSKGVQLNELIEKVKAELLSGAPAYPLFFIEKVELEIGITVTTEGKGNLNVQVLELGGGSAQTNGNIVKVTMSPILSLEEQRALLEKDGPMLDGVKRASLKALRKGAGNYLAGDAE